MDKGPHLEQWQCENKRKHDMISIANELSFLSVIHVRSDDPFILCFAFVKFSNQNSTPKFDQARILKKNCSRGLDETMLISPELHHRNSDCTIEDQNQYIHENYRNSNVKCHSLLVFKNQENPKERKLKPFPHPKYIIYLPKLTKTFE